VPIDVVAEDTFQSLRHVLDLPRHHIAHDSETHDARKEFLPVEREPAMLGRRGCHAREEGLPC
jgi:hypothetical protein